jgi:hypothetical protein
MRDDHDGNPQRKYHEGPNAGAFDRGFTAVVAEVFLHLVGEVSLVLDVVPENEHGNDECAEAEARAQVPTPYTSAPKPMKARFTKESAAPTASTQLGARQGRSCSGRSMR